MSIKSLMARKFDINSLPYKHSWREINSGDIFLLLSLSVVVVSFVLGLTSVFQIKSTKYKLSDLISISICVLIIMMAVIKLYKIIIKLTTTFELQINKDCVLYKKKKLFITSFIRKNNMSDYRGVCVCSEKRYPQLEDFSSYGVDVYVVSLSHQKDISNDIVLFETNNQSAAIRKATKYANMFGLEVCQPS